MDNKTFLLGLALGMVGGALIVANSKKARQMVQESQDQVISKAEKLTKRSCKHCNDQEE